MFPFLFKTSNNETRPSSPSPSLTSLELPPHASATPSLRASEPVRQPQSSSPSSSSSSSYSSLSASSQLTSDETLRQMQELFRKYDERK